MQQDLHVERPLIPSTVAQHKIKRVQLYRQDRRDVARSKAQLATKRPDYLREGGPVK